MLFSLSSLRYYFCIVCFYFTVYNIDSTFGLLFAKEDFFILFRKEKKKRKSYAYTLSRKRKRWETSRFILIPLNSKQEQKKDPLIKFQAVKLKAVLNFARNVKISRLSLESRD